MPPPSGTIRRFAPFRRGAAVLAAAAVVLAASGAGARAELSRSQEMKARAFNMLNDGIEAYRKGEIKKAIEVLEGVAKIALNSFRAFYYLGLAYKADRQYTKAIEPMTFALELEPQNLQAHVDLGDCHLKRGEMEEAMAEYHRSIAVQPGYAPAWDGLGRAAVDSGDDENAIENFRKAIDLNPGFPGSFLNLGDLYLRIDRVTEAVALFEKAIGVRPDFAAAYNRLGVAYARQRMPNDAIAALRKAAELEKGNPWHPYTIGLIEMDFGILSQAGADFDAAISLDRNYLEAYMAKARLLARLGDFDAAVRLLEEALTRPSELERVRRDIAVLRDEMASNGKSLQDLSARLQAGTATPDERRAIAKLRASVGDYSGAAAAMADLAPASGDPAGPLEPAAAQDLFAYGYYSLRAWSFEEAERAFARLRAARPASMATLLNLALSLQGQMKFAAAVSILEEAARLDPKDPTPRILMGNGRVLDRDWDRAAEDYRKALEAQAEFATRGRVETILKAIQERAER